MEESRLWLINGVQLFTLLPDLQDHYLLSMSRTDLKVLF